MTSPSGSATPGRRPPGWLRALGHRDFRVFWFGQLVSLTGTWMQTVAQAWLVLELTDSPLRLGLLSTFQFGPFLLLSFVGGVVADRVAKRRLLLATQSALAALAATLAGLVATGQVQYWHVAVLALGVGLINTLDTPTRQSFVVELVGKEDLVNAIALNSAAFNAARVFGPAVAGLLIGHWGLAAAFTLNAASFVAVILALFAVRAEGRPGARRGTSVLEDIAEALRYATSTPRIVLVLTLLLVVSLFVFNWNVVVPLFARQVLGQDARGLGGLMAVLGSGALTGAIFLAAVGRGRPSERQLFVAAALVACAALGLAFVRSLVLVAMLIYVMGAAGIVFMASCNTTVQLSVPDHLRGRMMGLYTLVFVGVAPFGGFIVGSIAETAGVPTSFLVGGSTVLVVLAGMAFWWYRRPRPETSLERDRFRPPDSSRS